MIINISLLCRYWWKKLEHEKGIWQDIVQAKYLHNSTMGIVKPHKNDSLRHPCGLWCHSLRGTVLLQWHVCLLVYVWLCHILKQIKCKLVET
jgi:hypothetical protein